MKELTLALILLLHFSSSRASSAILTGTQFSGYVIPKYAFQIQCALSDDGTLTGMELSDRSGGEWAVKTPIFAQIPSDQLDILKSSIEAAKAGLMKTADVAICDIGSTEILATGKDGAPFTILSAPDCSPSVENTSTAALELQAWVRDHCNFH